MKLNNEVEVGRKKVIDLNKNIEKLDKLLKSLPKEGSLYGKFKNPERISDVELSFHRNGITYHVFRKNIKGILIVPIEDKPSPGNSIYIK